MDRLGCMGMTKSLRFKELVAQVVWECSTGEVIMQHTQANVTHTQGIGHV